ncbi:hypothetical protein QTP70_020912 [Hemibagrus guttatus]|uniref:Uncharacterized protein n=1 Tax=Hemibagrus guttatus TaxID=175788 RepID=A0AAE0R4Z3_9TELE|nr:hypothetical protein QTP70_020912 [Hemibagrus guttatus]
MDSMLDAVHVQLAYEALIWFLRTSNQESIAAELSGAYVYHYNFVDVFYELLLCGYFMNTSTPDTGGFLERLFALINMWDVDVWEPTAKMYFTMLIDQLTGRFEVLFSQPLEHQPASFSQHR